MVQEEHEGEETENGSITWCDQSRSGGHLIINHNKIHFFYFLFKNSILYVFVIARYCLYFNCE